MKQLGVSIESLNSKSTEKKKMHRVTFRKNLF